jgi:hypothetical protein
VGHVTVAEAVTNRWGRLLRVCTHDGNAPRARQAAELRLAFAKTPTPQSLIALTSPV